ncbi:xylulokinase [uncultured Shimia sp.]|uniref:xylulokinase n=1 Tax=uncultured Shimia sp. TaxID=573152 RepID=UPI002622A60B|nr:xylulokinase [uncultured Shimia sp.]
MYLGLDLGTSGMRGVLVREDQSIVAEAEASYGTERPHPGWSEQDPAHWIQACDYILSELSEKAPDATRHLRAIGISGHMHGATLLDDQGEVLRPCILWNDTRSAAEARDLDSTENVRALSGNIVFPGFTAPKLCWVRNNEPEIFKKTAKVLLPKDYLNFWLTGAYASDMSDSAGTSWLDVQARDWSETLLDAGNMRADQMPKLFEGCEAVATLRPDLANRWGVGADVIIVAGAGDNAAAACGIGALNEGDGFVSLGTSGVLLAARDSYAPSPASAVHTFCHAVPNTWYQMGVILAATDSLNWLARALQNDAQTLTAALGETISGPGRVQFLPYLSGERTPHNDSTIRGALLELDINTGPEALTQAVLEGVAFALRDNLEALQSTGAQLTSAIAIGGGSKSPYWVELVATILGIPLHLPEKGEFGAALGAARLAICGATGASPDTVMTKPEIALTIEPRSDLSSDYQEAYASFKSLYPGIKALTS